MTPIRTTTDSFRNWISQEIDVVLLFAEINWNQQLNEGFGISWWKSTHWLGTSATPMQQSLSSLGNKWILYRHRSFPEGGQWTCSKNHNTLGGAYIISFLRNSMQCWSSEWIPRIHHRMPQQHQWFRYQNQWVPSEKLEFRRMINGLHARSRLHWRHLEHSITKYMP